MAVQQIKFKRGTKADLIAKLTKENSAVLAAGEPAFETDTGQVKIGDGTHSYEYLPYVGGEGSSTDGRFVIQDPEANQVLLYDETSGKWVNKDLADAKSIVYLSEHGLTIKGYDEATQGKMLVKDTTNGLAWIDPINDTQLQQAVANAEQSANTAGAYATSAGTSASNASTYATTAEKARDKVIDYVNEKFWWGSLDEYNALESINPGTFYFITAEK